jgi:hypothetical protein
MIIKRIFHFKKSLQFVQKIKNLEKLPRTKERLYSH